MKQTRPLVRLADPEAAKARAVLAQHGPERTTRMLGLSDTRTLFKALAQVPVHPLTASTIRAHLANKL